MQDLKHFAHARPKQLSNIAVVNVTSFMIYSSVRYRVRWIKSLICSKALSDAAGLAAALTAAPVHSSKQAHVAFQMPAAKTARNSLPFNWPKICRNVGGTHVSLRSIDTYDFKVLLLFAYQRLDIAPHA